MSEVTMDTGTRDALLICSVRYALGRSTYMVGLVCEAVRQQWDSVGRGARDAIIRDIDEALTVARFEGRLLGMRMDHNQWAALLSWVRAQEGDQR